jgi:aminoglycoside 6-adenylyltransferase
MLDRIREWASREQDIRTLLMVGSRGGNGKTDKLSDYDISVFGPFEEWSISDEWLLKLSPYWICIRDQFQWAEKVIPTRLVIFKSGIKVDFAFHPSRFLEQMIQSRQLFPAYDSGYMVILDKDEIATQLPHATFTGFIRQVPGQEEFSYAWNEFWFEAYHVAKYLRRADFWIAGTRDNAMKKWLLKMLEWYAASKPGFQLAIGNEGKNLQAWIDEKYYCRLESCFSGCDQSGGINALYATLDLFSDLSKETAATLSLSLNTEIGEGMRSIITDIISFSDVKE